MFNTIMMMFKLTWRNWCWLWHVYACCISQDIKTGTSTFGQNYNAPWSVVSLR